MSALGILEQKVQATIQKAESNPKFSEDSRHLLRMAIDSCRGIAEAHGVEAGMNALATLQPYCSGSVSAYISESEPETKPATAYADWDILYDNKHKGMHMEFLI